MTQATRLLTKNYEDLTQKDIVTLCAKDIEAPVISVPVKPLGLLCDFLPFVACFCPIQSCIMSPAVLKYA